jgi:hypothetical protein
MGSQGPEERGAVGTGAASVASFARIVGFARGRERRDKAHPHSAFACHSPCPESDAALRTGTADSRVPENVTSAKSFPLKAGQKAAQ